MKQRLFILATVFLFASCAQKANTNTIKEDTNSIKVQEPILEDENINYNKIPNQAEDEMHKLPDFSEIIKTVTFSDNGGRVKNIVNFFAPDSLMITADVYTVNRESPFILLCHQAGYSRGEYINTVKELMQMGFNCVALDQRSGDAVNGVVNETAKLAKEKGLPTAYLDAKTDIETAIAFTYELNNKKPIIIVGSSYSATLVMLLAKNNPKIKKVAAFSPGEYFKGVSIMESLAGFDKPVYATAAKNEIQKVEEMTKLISPSYLTIYKPKEKGIHGSRALWFSTPGYTGYWNTFKAFLNKD
jgi:predicted alpha/beta-fold hydrolase